MKDKTKPVKQPSWTKPYVTDWKPAGTCQVMLDVVDEGDDESNHVMDRGA